MENEQKKLNQIIIEAMKRYDLNVEKLSQLTNISERYLLALVEEKYYQLPAAPYLRAYLKKIANFLNLDSEELWLIYQKNIKEIKKVGEKDTLPQNRFLKKSIFNRSLIFFLILVVLIIFLIVKNFGFFSPPIIFYNLPQEENFTTNEKEITLKGKINGKELYLNNNRYYPDKEGNFEIRIRLEPGLNILSFRIKQKLGREKIINKHIIYYE